MCVRVCVCACEAVAKASWEEVLIVLCAALIDHMGCSAAYLKTVERVICLDIIYYSIWKSNLNGLQKLKKKEK